MLPRILVLLFFLLLFGHLINGITNIFHGGAHAGSFRSRGVRGLLLASTVHPALSHRGRDNAGRVSVPLHMKHFAELRLE